MTALILWFCGLWIVYGLWFDAFMERQRDRAEDAANAARAAGTAAFLAYWKDEQHADALRMDATRRACGFCHGTGRLADDIPCPGCIG